MFTLTYYPLDSDNLIGYHSIHSSRTSSWHTQLHSNYIHWCSINRQSYENFYCRTGKNLFPYEYTTEHKSEDFHMLSKEYIEYIEIISANVRQQAIEMLCEKEPYEITPERFKKIIELFGGTIKNTGSSSTSYVSQGNGYFEIHCNENIVSNLELAHEVAHHYLLEQGKSQKGTTAFFSRPSLAGASQTELTLLKDSVEAELSHPFDSDPDKWFLHEMAADYFARALLLPKDEFIKVVSNCPYSNYNEKITAVARVFGVPRYLVESRGKELELWGNENA